jgi:hypothetical protein
LQATDVKNLLRILVSVVLALTASALHAGNLKVTIAPSQAVTAGVQWRLDAGAWNASGTTLKNLTKTTHTVDFKAVTGWITPAPFSVTLSGNGTTSSTGTYIQAASLTVNLTPAAAQWRVDAGAWRNSGTAATGLAPGNHTVEFGAFAGYTTLAPTTIALTAGQSQTLNRTYAAQANLGITLSPGSGQWRVNGGAWRASGTTAGLDAGTWTIDYAAVANYQTPTSETVTLTAGQSLNLTRTYTILPASLP